MFVRWMGLCGLGVSMLTLAMASQAHAQSCDANSDCPKGFTCEESGATNDVGCARAAAPCPPEDPECAKAEDVPCAEDKPAEPEKYCAPAKCTADSDCGEGMICYAYETTECDGAEPQAGCAKGEECPAYDAGKPDCKTVKADAICIPRYFAPCDKAADCGEGFTCDAKENCSCFGSSGGGSGDSAGDPSPGAFAAPMDAGQAEDPKDACDCTVDEDAPKSCDIVEIDCEDASDCPATWTCEDRAKSGGDVACVSKDLGPDGGVSEGCGASEEKAAAVEEKRCMPPYADLYGRDSYEDSNSLGGSKSGTGGDEETATGGGLPQAAHDADDNSDGGVGSAEDKDDSKCSVTRVHGSSQQDDHAWLAALGLVGLAFVARRRARLAR